MGPIFYQKNPQTWVNFSDRAQIFGFSHGENPRNRELFEKWAYFSRKILKNGYPFLPKSPLKMGRGFEAWAAHPCPTQIWVPPRDYAYHQSSLIPLLKQQYRDFAMI